MIHSVHAHQEGPEVILACATCHVVERVYPRRLEDLNPFIAQHRDVDD